MVKMWALPRYVLEISHDHPGYDTLLLKDGRLLIIDDQGIGIYNNADDHLDGHSPDHFIPPVEAV